jgi:ribosomal protein S18 acetylase RimI-like enzyme
MSRASSRPGVLAVRQAGAPDAEELARIRIASWRVAYRGIVPDAVLDSFDPVSEAVTWRERLAGPAAAWMWVASFLEPPVSPPRLAGYVAAGPARHAGEGNLGEVWAIYVDPEAQRRGVGRALMAAATRGLAVHGFREAVLWVFEANAPARAFYERLGWAPDGAAKPFAIGGAAPIELRYWRRLE